jgi:Protein of unknown function (DUF3575)
MKKALFFCIVLVSLGFSQDKKESDDFNEIKGNVLIAPLGMIEVVYEKDFSEHQGFGIAAFFRFSDVDLHTKFSLTPYYRYYFGKESAKGFFAEGFAMYNQYQPNDKLIFTGFVIQMKESPVQNDLAFGLGMGSKWLIGGDFILEINAGFGLNLFNENSRKSTLLGERYVPRLGISLGQRF